MRLSVGPGIGEVSGSDHAFELRQPVADNALHNRERLGVRVYKVVHGGERGAHGADHLVRVGGQLGDGAAVIALEQTAGRGRSGRSWAQVPVRGLALSVALLAALVTGTRTVSSTLSPVARPVEEGEPKRRGMEDTSSVVAPCSAA